MKIKNKPKKCIVCSKEFMPWNSTERTCSPACFYKWQDSKKKPIKAPKPKKVYREPSSRTKIKAYVKKIRPYCQLRTFPEVSQNRHTYDLHAHHIIYLSEGGPDELWNLIVLCQDCHRTVHSSKIKWQLRCLQIVNGIDLAGIPEFTEETLKQPLWVNKVELLKNEL